VSMEAAWLKMTGIILDQPLCLMTELVTDSALQRVLSMIYHLLVCCAGAQDLVALAALKLSTLDAAHEAALSQVCCSPLMPDTPLNLPKSLLNRTGCSMHANPSIKLCTSSAVAGSRWHPPSAPSARQALHNKQCHY
jgi:hypothetical protein